MTKDKTDIEKMREQVRLFDEDNMNKKNKRDKRKERIALSQLKLEERTSKPLGCMLGILMIIFCLSAIVLVSKEESRQEGYDQAKDELILPAEASEVIPQWHEAWNDIQTDVFPITEEQRWRIAENWEAYELSGCDANWMAALHRRETGLDVGNNNPFQMSGGVSQDTSFNGLIEDAKTACQTLHRKAGGSLPNEINTETIGLWADATWRYNGTAYGSWDRSPFVTSNLDSSKTNMQKCAVDGCDWLTTDRHDGVMTTYLKLLKGIN